MINQVNVEGYVTSTWRYGNDLMIRLASYRDPYLPQLEKDKDGRDKPDYMNARLVNGAIQGIDFPKGKQIRIEGFICSNDSNETLEDFLSRSNERTLGSHISVEIVGGTAKDIFVPRSNWEVQIVHYVMILPKKTEDNNATSTRKPDLNPNAGKKSVSAETKK